MVDVLQLSLYYVWKMCSEVLGVCSQVLWQFFRQKLLTFAGSSADFSSKIFKAWCCNEPRASSFPLIKEEKQWILTHRLSTPQNNSKCFENCIFPVACAQCRNLDSSVSVLVQNYVSYWCIDSFIRIYAYTIYSFSIIVTVCRCAIFTLQDNIFAAWYKSKTYFSDVCRRWHNLAWFKGS